MFAALQNVLTRTGWLILIGLMIVALAGWLGYNGLVARQCRRGSTLPPYPGMTNARCKLVDGKFRLVHFTTPDNPFTIWATYDRILGPRRWRVSGLVDPKRPNTWYLEAPAGWQDEEDFYAWGVYLHMSQGDTETAVDVMYEVQEVPVYNYSP